MCQSLNTLLLSLHLLLKLFSVTETKKNTKKLMFKKFIVEFDIP